MELRVFEALLVPESSKKARQIEVFLHTSSSTVCKTAGQTETTASVLVYMEDSTHARGISDKKDANWCQMAVESSFHGFLVAWVSRVSGAQGLSKVLACFGYFVELQCLKRSMKSGHRPWSWLLSTLGGISRQVIKKTPWPTIRR